MKPRKSQHLKWQPVPATLHKLIMAHTADCIASTEEHHRQWFQMTCKQFPIVINHDNTAASNTEASSSSAAPSITANER